MYRFFLFITLSVIGNKLVLSQIDIQADDIIGSRLLLLDPLTKPTLEYICVKEHPSDISYLSEALIHPIDKILQFQWDDNTSDHNKSFYLSTITSSSISNWMLGKYIENIDINLPLDSFLLEESYKIEVFLEKQHELQLKELAFTNQAMEDRNLSKALSATPTDPKLKKNKRSNEKSEEGFTKFALYLIIGGGICVIYSVLIPTGSSTKGDEKIGKIELARRKRWLKKVLEKGWIDKTTYNFLLERIETLPEWLGKIRTLDQSKESSESSETSVPLSNLKSGESVVKTKDTSADNTSR